VSVSELRRFTPWFYAAALYNLAWGTLVATYPAPVAELADASGETVFLRVVGLFVLVYAPAYWWVARRPEHYPQLVVIAVLGKIFGAAGFVAALAAGVLPARFVAVIVLNDLVWLPPFMLYLRAAARAAGGWRTLLAG
jgi:hypothetical protein